MTVESTVTRHSYYPGSAMAQEALKDIVWLAAADLVVTRTLSTGTVTTLALDDDYQLGGDGANAAGWIKALAAEDAGTIYRITRETTLTQRRKFPKFQPIDASQIEAGLDAAMLAAQELRSDQEDLGGRALRVPVGETVAELPSKLLRQNSLIGCDVNGDPIAVAMGTPYISQLANMVSAGLDIMTTGTASDLQSNLTPFLQQAMEDASRYGGGAILFPGKGYVFQCGGNPVTYGDWTYILSGQTATQTMKFNRGLIEIQNNVTLRGNGAKLMLAPGYTCPPPLFYNPFWLGVQKTGFHLEGLELDGNQDNQIILPVNAAGDYGTTPWLHGNGVTHIGVSNVSARRCIFRNWRGMGLGGGPAPDMGLLGDGYLAEHCEFVDNFNGSIQWAGHRLYMLYNWHHGNGGWTAFEDIEVESEASGYDMLDIWSIGELFDGRDGVLPPESFINPAGGSPGYASDSAEALAMQVHFTRGLYLSGNFTTSNPGGVFNEQRGRVSIIHPKCWQSNVGGGGVDRTIIDSPTIDITYEANAVYATPQDLNAISAWPTSIGDSGTGLSEFKVRDATIRNDMPSYGFFCGGYEWVEFSGTIAGGRSAGIRLEACSGKVDVRVLNVGGTDTAGSPDYAGDHTSGVVIWGPKGPTDITIRAADTRGAGALMKYAVLVNGSADKLVNTTIMSQSGLLNGGVREVVANTTITFDRSTITPTLNRKLVLAGGLEAHGSPTFISDDGDLNLNLYSPNGTARKINFFTTGTAESGFQGQLEQLADGRVQLNIYDDGAPVGTPMAWNADGSMDINATWQAPIHIPGIGYLWVSATTVLRIKASKPTADNDGVAVGSQS